MRGPDHMTRPSGPRRWHEQRWLIDSVLRTEGLEWDQPRIAYTLRPMGVDATPDFAVATSRISKFADIAPVFTERAQRRHAIAVAAEREQKLESAREHYFHAALLYVTAEWPIWETTPALIHLDELKNECFNAYARLADHHVESVDIRLGDSYIPAWFHLPPGYQGGSVRTVIYCGGMDAPKELNVSLYGDKLLQRGFAVLTFDGPARVKQRSGACISPRPPGWMPVPRSCNGVETAPRSTTRRSSASDSRSAPTGCRR
jgi:hypothetical protein